MGVYPDVLREVLAHAGHADISPIVARWRESGAMPKPSHGRQSEARRPEGKVRLYAFAWTALGDLTGREGI